MFESLIKQFQKGKVLSVPVDKIAPNPYQSRVFFDKQALEGLAQSIYESGILQPLSLRRLRDGTFQLIAGERRLRAAKMIGLSRVPAIIVSADDRKAAVLSVLENLQRQDLDFFEEAEGLAYLTRLWGYTQHEAASKLGMTQSTLANKLRLLRLGKHERERIRKHGLTERHARALLQLNSERQRSLALDVVIEQKLNVAQTEKLIDKIKNDTYRPHKQTTYVIKDIRIFENTLKRAVRIMKKSGIDVTSLSTEYKDYFEYIVRIPKEQASPERLA